MTGIEHKQWFNGEIQALTFEDEHGKKSVGVVSPGIHDFGIADAPEEIVVFYGMISINGKSYSALQTCQIKAGDPIIFEAKNPAAYICYKR